MQNNRYRKPKVVILSSPSGGGKSSIAAEILKRDQNITLSISATTRAPRSGEVDGVHYFFRNRVEFEKMRANNELLEVAQIYGNLYGTPRKFVEQQLAEGKDVLFDIDSQGAYQLMEIFSDEIISIFIIPPSLDVLKERLILRGQDSLVTIEKRLGLVEIEMKEAENYEYMIVNVEFEKTVAKILEIINSRRGIIPN